MEDMVVDVKEEAAIETTSTPSSSSKPEPVDGDESTGGQEQLTDGADNQQGANNDDVQDQVNCDEEPDCDLDNFVPEYAFWHIEASLDNGFEVGMRVEVEHEPQKYWIATIVGVYGKLLSLKWEGSTEEIFLDVSKKRCYPAGFYRNQPNYYIEPPPKINLSDKAILDVTIKHFQTPSRSNLPEEFYARGGVSVDLFELGTVVEVAHKLNPEKHWFARVVRNIGGRLLLRWLVKQSEEDVSHDFWLFFCHSRVHYVGFAKEAGNIAYEPPVVYESWITHIQDYLSNEDNGISKLRRCFLSAAKDKKPELLEIESGKAVSEGDKVLLFPSNLLKLLPATVESKLTKDTFRISANGPSGLINFCYPYDDNHAILPMSWSDEHEIPVEFESEEHGSLAEYLTASSSKAAPISLKANEKLESFVINGKIEVVHPDQPDMICEAIVIRVTAPLIWIQLSAESIYVLPFTSTDLFSSGFCETHNYPLTKLLQSSKKVLSSQLKAEVAEGAPADQEPVQSDLAATTVASSLMPAGSKAWCPRIYFNHKCFTGPSLSKSKICELPRFVGPGPVLLVIHEVISKIISVAYVPSRVLNELSNKSFETLLKKKKIKKLEKVEFKAKYQKRTYRDHINIVRTAEQVEEFCDVVCSHLKCCYHLFGLNLYDGDTCPSNCRGLTKSNKVLKRATFYRDKALEEKKAAQKQAENPKNEAQDKDEKEPETEKSGSKKSSESEEEVEEEPEKPAPPKKKRRRGLVGSKVEAVDKDNDRKVDDENPDFEQDVQDADVKENNGIKVEPETIRGKIEAPKKKILTDKPTQEFMDPLENPLNWSVNDVHRFITKSECPSFASILRDHEIDGPALMLLDYETIRTNIFTGYTRKITLEDIAKLSRLINRVKTKWFRMMRLGARGSTNRQ
ncbi:Scm-like with four MBT domains protein 2 [Halotydeus destructor]|nr:Scm-like with four MBT domains protein 2 [Halotydeus destructor]